MTTRTAWQLYDPELDVTYYMPTNPYQDGGSFAITRQIGYSVMAGWYQDDLNVNRLGTIVSSGTQSLEQFSFTGRTYDSSHHAAMEEWVNKDYPVYLTDDLGRSWLVMIESFSPRRLPTMKNRPFKHEYTLTGFVLEEVESTPEPVVSLGDMIVVGDSLSALGYSNGEFTADHRWHDAVLASGIVDNVYSGAELGLTTYTTRQKIDNNEYLAPPAACDVFVVFLGANDVNTTTASLQNLGIAEITTTEYRDHLIWFLDNYPAPIQIVMYPWRWVYSSQPDIPVDESVYIAYRNAAQQAAAARGAIFIDVGANVPDATAYTADGIHCNELGITRLAALVRGVL